jgi:hypothetical protein
MALDIHEREPILLALDDPPAGLEELRALCCKRSRGADGRVFGTAGRGSHAVYARHSEEVTRKVGRGG